MEHYDLIVLGTGGVGSASLYHAARGGLRALGLDRFPPAHDRGSSHGESRLIRLSYIEHPDYVPLLRRSYDLWDALDPSLLHRSGLFYAGPQGSPTLEGVLASAREHELRVDRVAPEAFPQYCIPSGHGTLFEPDAGWLPVERCVLTHLRKATDAGAIHRWGEEVLSWKEDASGVTVLTDAGQYHADSLVISGGPWSGELLSGLALPLSVQRKHLHWFRCEDPRYVHGFFFEAAEGKFYGFPARDGMLKLAEHSGGEPIEDPLHAGVEQDPADSERIDGIVARYLPGVASERLRHKTCFYTRTPDEHFILDRYPGSERVVFAAGLSGHGFKFTPVLGELLVQLATGVEPSLAIGFLGRGRFE